MACIVQGDAIELEPHPPKGVHATRLLKTTSLCGTKERGTLKKEKNNAFAPMLCFPLPSLGNWHRQAADVDNEAGIA